MLLEDDPVAAVSFTFGCPPADVVARLQAVGSTVWVTVTDVDEAQRAAAAGADVLIVQGIEAGGHRASFVDDEGAGEYGLLALLQLVGAHTDLPLVASGAIASGGAVAAVLCAGAQAAQLGTAFMRCPEAGTSPAHRAALAGSRPDAPHARLHRPQGARHRQPLPRASTPRTRRSPTPRSTTSPRPCAPPAGRPATPT